MKFNYYIGLDEVNKASFYGAYYFGGFVMDNKIYQKIKNISNIGDSKTRNIINNLRVSNEIKKITNNYFIHLINPKNYDQLLGKYNINLNDLTLIGHIITLANIFSSLGNDFINKEIIIIIDDFMKNKKNKYDYFLETLKLLKKINKTKLLPNIKSEIFKMIENNIKNIKLITKSESKFKSVAIISQLLSTEYYYDFIELSKKYNIEIANLFKAKNNYEMVFKNNFANDIEQHLNFLNNEIRILYPKKTLNKAKNFFNIFFNSLNENEKKILTIKFKDWIN